MEPEEWLSGFQNYPKNYEIEFRMLDVDQKFFSRFGNRLKKQCQSTSTFNIIDVRYKNDIRYTYDNSSKVGMFIKKKLIIKNQVRFGKTIMNATISTETPTYAVPDTIILNRIKERQSYFFNNLNLRVDLTKVWQTEPSQKNVTKKYEIEFEIIDNSLIIVESEITKFINQCLDHVEQKEIAKIEKAKKKLMKKEVIESDHVQPTSMERPPIVLEDDEDVFLPF